MEYITPKAMPMCALSLESKATATRDGKIGPMKKPSSNNPINARLDLAELARLPRLTVANKANPTTNQAPVPRPRNCDDSKKLDEFRKKAFDNLAEDGSGHLVYLASSRVNLALTEERWPEIRFLATREL
jgi:hypothetical protein